jgi:hypothetical protein
VSATPGPWWVDVHSNVLGPGGGLVAFPGIAFGYDEKANARLIAKSPELLHCLKVICCHAEGREDLDAALHLDVARALIAEVEAA